MIEWNVIGFRPGMLGNHSRVIELASNCAWRPSEQVWPFMLAHHGCYLVSYPTQIISGGQTGVDQAALDAAIEVGVPHGGWCPRGRISENGPIPEKYCLTETESSKYSFRTEQNVIDSDATLILYRKKLSGGTAFTLRMAQKHDKPFLLADLTHDDPFTIIWEWIEAVGADVLNVAGPRESSAEGIFAEAKALLMRIFIRFDNTSDS